MVEFLHIGWYNCNMQWYCIMLNKKEISIMKKFRRIVSLALCIGMVASLLAGCGGAEKTVKNRAAKRLFSH